MPNRHALVNLELRFLELRKQKCQSCGSRDLQPGGDMPSMATVGSPEIGVMSVLDRSCTGPNLIWLGGTERRVSAEASVFISESMSGRGASAPGGLRW